MKKFLLFAVSALVALPMITSCGGPSGDPKKDAESCKDLIKKKLEIELKQQEKNLEILEYYADKKDAKAYADFNEQLQDVIKDANNEFEKENRDKIKELEKKAKEATDKLNDKSSSSDAKD